MTQIPTVDGTTTVKLPVWATVRESYRFLAAHPRDLVRIGWLPLSALFVLNLAFGTFDPMPDTSDSATLLASIGPMMGRAVANLLIQSAVAAMTLVVWHRLVMLGPEAAGRQLPVRAGLREFRYLGSWMLISVVFLGLMTLVDVAIVLAFFAAMVASQAVMMFTGGAGMALGGQGEVLTLVGRLGMPFAVVVAVYFTIRLSLVLPATATGKQAGFGRAWSVSAGNGLRMAAASLIVMAPLQILVLGLTQATRSAAGSWPFYPLALLASLGFLLFILVTGTVLSLFSLGLDRAAAAGPEEEASGRLR